MWAKLRKLISAEQPVGNTLEPSIFIYDEDGQGFKLVIDLKSTHFQWNDIETVFGYKIDCLTYDKICLDIFIDNGQSFSVTESTLGWHEFNELLTSNISAILVSRQDKIVG